jgi:hypothetical protein
MNKRKRYVANLPAKATAACPPGSEIDVKDCPNNNENRGKIECDTKDPVLCKTVRSADECDTKSRPGC